MDLDTVDQDFAIQEFNHRIANSLALLIAGLNRDFAQVESPSLRAALRRHENQIVNIGALYRLLANEPASDECGIASYFQPLCRALARSVLTPLSIDCEACLGEGALPTKQCTRLAQIICELVMNSAKHAFPDSRGGHVKVDIFTETRVCCCIV